MKQRTAGWSGPREGVSQTVKSRERGVPVARQEGGTPRSSEEAPVMGVERRGRVVGSRSVINQGWEESHDRDKISGQTV